MAMAYQTMRNGKVSAHQRLPQHLPSALGSDAAAPAGAAPLDMARGRAALSGAGGPTCDRHARRRQASACWAAVHAADSRLSRSYALARWHDVCVLITRAHGVCARRRAPPRAPQQIPSPAAACRMPAAACRGRPLIYSPLCLPGSGCCCPGRAGGGVGRRLARSGPSSTSSKGTSVSFCAPPQAEPAAGPPAPECGPRGACGGRMDSAR